MHPSLLATSLPPGNVLGVILFVVAAILAGVPEPRASRWWPVFLCLGLAAAFWPWQ